MDISETKWATPGILSAMGIAAIYVLTHDTGMYPALYWAMADAIHMNGYLLPSRIQHFTANGIPFGYPPLGFYILAGIVDVTGLSYRYASFYLRLLYFILTLIAGYLVARQFTTRTAAGLAAVLIAVSPPITRWHLGHGGVIRGLAFIFSLLTIAFALRAFRTSDLKYVIAAGLTFGFTILAHPVYPVFAGFGTAALWLGVDRSTHGFKSGAAIATVGLLVASPWLFWALSTHGWHLFLYASQTHGSLFDISGHIGALLMSLTRPMFGVIERGVWYLGIVSVAILAYERRMALLTWFGAAGLMLGGHVRFTYTILVIAISILVVEYLPQYIVKSQILESEFNLSRNNLRRASFAIAAVGLIFVAGYSGAAAAIDLPNDTYSQADREAAEWAHTSTSPNATFLAQYEAEEFPFFAQRTSLIVPWGAEWDGPNAYQHHLAMLSAVQECETPKCIHNVSLQSNLNPDYLYLERAAINETSFNISNKYTIQYQNREVIIVAVEGGSMTYSRSRE